MDLLYILLILLLMTRGFGELSERLGQPSLVGELLAGVTLGAIVGAFPDQFPALGHINGNEIFTALTDLGMLFLMLYAGIEMQPQKILKASGGAFVVAIGGMVVPLVMGVGLGWLFLPDSELFVAQCVFLGTAVAITAVPATIRVLMDMGWLETDVGQTIVSAAVFDDILSLLLLAWMSGMLAMGEMPGGLGLALLIGKVVLFFLITSFAGRFLFPWLARNLDHFKEHEVEISLVLGAAFAFAILAELMGLHFIVGAFMAGVFFGRQTFGEVRFSRIRNTLSGMTFGFLAPIFFASIGLHFSLQALAEVPLFVAALVAVALVGKMLGAGLAARLNGFDRQDALIVGIGMTPRGEMELVIAGIALKAGLFDMQGQSSPIIDNMFSAVVVMAIITTVISPIILRLVFHDRRR
ncbi:cation:proton antiporter [Aestuariispira insulae]|uniref:Transporter (CPA2 family) n=1 Tax=Aestuariispira insulae TaxID=1461337 RepID=A0A3D9HLP2_9PROT|nr:cation:proton antiporter [Aestuariispira insulae]RED49816.1 transporter (CPA2 family) [Aestuariispira insulae]